MKIYIAFLAYNQATAKYLNKFLASLDQAILKLTNSDSSLSLKLLMGDNSDDGQKINQDILNTFKFKSELEIEILDFQLNLGFAKAYNKLLAFALSKKADYFLILNPDLIVDEDFFKALVLEIKEGATKADIIIPKLYRWDFLNDQKTKIIDSCGIGLRAGLRFFDIAQGQEEDGKREQEIFVFGASGAAALYDLNSLAQYFKDNYFFDESFFMYKEDCDLAYRLESAGYNTKLLSSAIAYHDRTSARELGLLKTFKAWRKRSKLSRSWSFKNQHYLFIKHFKSEGFFSKLLILLRTLLLFLFSLIFAQFLLKSYKDILKFLKKRA